MVNRVKKIYASYSTGKIWVHGTCLLKCGTYLFHFIVWILFLKILWISFNISWILFHIRLINFYWTYLRFVFNFSINLISFLNFFFFFKYSLNFFHAYFKVTRINKHPMISSGKTPPHRLWPLHVLQSAVVAWLKYNTLWDDTFH